MAAVSFPVSMDQMIMLSSQMVVIINHNISIGLMLFLNPNCYFQYF